MAIDFWERVNETIRQQKTTQEWVANKAGLNYQTLRGWVTKGMLPRADDAEAIAQALRTSVDYLITGKDSLGFSSPIREIAQSLSELSGEDIEEIKAIIDVKLARRRSQEAEDSNVG